MKNIFDRTRTIRVAASSLVIAAAMVAPQALANGDGSAQRIQQLEQSLQAIQAELEKIKSESSQTVQKVNSIEQSNANLEKRAAASTGSADVKKGHRVFFRGGFTHAMDTRTGSSIASNVAPVGAQDRADKDGFYVGAGLDWNLTDDAWGFLPRTSVLAELMFEYKEFGDKVQGNALANAPTQLAGGSLNPRTVTVSQFTLTAAPKIKFMEGSKIRPWIIPGGLALHVVSPTTESVTYLAPGIMFGAGLEYNVWKDFYVGMEGRYNLTTGPTDGVRVDGMTAGGYVGIGF